MHHDHGHGIYNLNLFKTHICTHAHVAMYTSYLIPQKFSQWGHPHPSYPGLLSFLCTLVQIVNMRQTPLMLFLTQVVGTSGPVRSISEDFKSLRNGSHYSQSRSGVPLQ